ncbi:unnamed protein product [Linum tenue]|uniref:Uncharacterized protein n=1 Tax=Linum tenue TaxID=586396 RepID=A0AAV0L2Z2_9ROSI|nr:unnamed protein product [Linum tenue]CAI0428551.1 unnamed protein product [Linum tenue]CAI0428958.1 unnamed protein product [Linum tenue]
MRTRKMQILMKMGRSMTIEAEPRGCLLASYDTDAIMS